MLNLPYKFILAYGHFPGSFGCKRVQRVKVHGVIVAERRRVHYLVIIIVDPYIPYYIIGHEWIYILTQMQECIWTISQPPV